MLIRQKTANAAKTSLFGTHIFSDTHFDPTSLQDYEISHKIDPSFLTHKNKRLASCIWHHQLKSSVFTLLIYLCFPINSWSIETTEQDFKMFRKIRSLS